MVSSRIELSGALAKLPSKRSNSGRLSSGTCVKNLAKSLNTTLVESSLGLSSASQFG